MWGSTRSTTSPSSSSTSRSTPCAAGCCGPKLMVKLRTSVSAIVQLAISANLGRCGRFLLGHLGVEAIPGDDCALVTAFADEIDAIMGAQVERGAPALHV